MNLKVKILSFLVIVLLSTFNLVAQEEEITEETPWSIGADFVSRYVWRGLNLGGPSPSIQPYLEYGFGTDDHSFAVGAWSAYSISGVQTSQEVDFYFTYTLKENLTLTITDYFFPNDTIGRNNYFNRNMNWDKINSGTKNQTGHVVEATISFKGTEKLPFSLMFAMNIWGADSRKYEDQGGIMIPVDDIVMSKYLELGYSTEVKGMSIDVFAGMVLDSPEIDKGEPTGFYGQEKAGITNLGITVSKEVQIASDFALPVSGSLIMNPEAENIFMVFGISL